METTLVLHDVGRKNLKGEFCSQINLVAGQVKKKLITVFIISLFRSLVC